MLLCWEQANSNKLDECKQFARFSRDEFRYDAEILQIKGNGYNPNKKHLNVTMPSFVAPSSPRALGILFYSGYAYSNATSRTAGTRKDYII